MTDLSQVPDRDLILELYRRMQGDDEMSRYRNYCYRSALRPIYAAFDRADIDEANIRMYSLPKWSEIEAQRDEAMAHFPDHPPGPK
jgi:hypothetical protein